MNTDTAQILFKQASLLLIPTGGKSGKSIVNKDVLSAKMCHANLDTNAAMTSNASYGCVSAEKGTTEGLYESLFDDESQYIIYDNYSQDSR